MRKHIILCSLGFTLLSFAKAQIISGQIIDEQTNRPIEGVNISMKGTAKATVSNKDGYFSFNILNNPNTEIIFSMIGYITKSYVVKAQGNSIAVFLTPKKILLNEVKITNRNLSASDLLKRALLKVPVKYQKGPQLFTAFYSEALLKNGSLDEFVETEIQTVKESYNHYYTPSKVFINKIFNVKKESNKTTSEIINGVSMIHHNDFLSAGNTLFNTEFYNLFNIAYQTSPDPDCIAIHFSKITASQLQTYGYIIINKQDTAILKIAINNKTGKNRSIRTEVNYKQFNDYYLLNSIYKNATNKSIEAKTTLIVTDITDKQNISQGNLYEENTSLKNYIETERDKFWRGTDALYLDSALYNKIRALQTEVKHKQNLENTPDNEEYITKTGIILPINFEIDALHVNKTFNLVDRAINHILASKVKNGELASLTQLAIPLILTNPLRNILSEYSYLNNHHLYSKANFTIFNKYLQTYISSPGFDKLDHFKTIHNTDFVRFYLLRSENNYLATTDLEDEMFVQGINKYDKKELFLNVYFMDIFGRRITQTSQLLFPNFMFFNAKNNSFLGNDFFSFAYYLHRPNNPYIGKIDKNQLNNIEMDFIKQAKIKSLINLISPFIIASPSFTIGTNALMNFSLNYSLAPFGQLYAENFYIKYKTQNFAVLLKQYQNYHKMGLGIGVKHFNYRFAPKLDLNTEVTYFKQPKNQSYYEKVFVDGFSCQQMLSYSASNKLLLSFGYLAKSAGYTVYSYNLDNSFYGYMGLKINL